MNEKEKFFVGSIIHRQKKKVYDKKSKWYGQIFYKLTITNAFQTHKLFAYANLLKESLWKIISNKNYQGDYFFSVKKSKWGWVLLDFRARNN